MVTARDIAKMIGVSEATFSLVLHNKKGVSEKTRTMVIERVNELGYGYLLKDAAGTIPAKQPSDRIVTFVLYKNHGELLGMNSFFPLILDGTERAARQHGYTLSVVNIEREHAKKESEFIPESGCSGFVIFATEMHEDDLEVFQDLHLPFVVLDNYFIDKNICTVRVNNEQGICMLLSYLQKMGHHKVGYLSSGLAINSFIERRAAAVRYAQMLGMKGLPENIFQIGYPKDRAREGMEALLRTKGTEDLPSVFLADNDLVAAGAMQAALGLGFRIPEDLSFAGYDDRPICDYLSPGLTTVQIPREMFGAIAVEHLVGMIEARTGYGISTAVNGRLIERGSIRDLRDGN